MDEADLAEVRATLRRWDAERWRTTLFARGPAHARLTVLYAFNVEIARVRETVSEPILGNIRLQWWREALAEIAAGGPVRRHPLVAAIAAAGLDPEALGRLVDARERDLDDGAFADLDALESYAAATSGALSVAAFRACGVADRDETAAAAGTAYGLAGLLRALPHFARRRRNVLPADLVAAAGLTFETIHEGKAGAALGRAVEPVARRAIAHLARIGNVPRAARAAALPAVLARLWLSRLAAHGHDAFAPALQAPHPGDIWRLAFANLVGRL